MRLPQMLRLAAAGSDAAAAVPQLLAAMVEDADAARQVAQSLYKVACCYFSGARLLSGAHGLTPLRAAAPPRRNDANRARE
jgi:hypothetical protein